MPVPGFCRTMYALFLSAEALKCYHCNNLDNPACGVLFKPYQFVAQPCQGHSSRDFKCVLQREPPTGKGIQGNGLL